MKDRVVCLKSGWTSSNGLIYPDNPIKGEIYTITNINPDGYLEFFEFPKDKGNARTYNPKFFRPVDDTFGEVVCETLSQQLELEKALQYEMEN